MAHKKCLECEAPLEGLLYNTLGKVFGIKPSKNNSEICNKCESDAKPKAKKAEKEQVTNDVEEVVKENKKETLKEEEKDTTSKEPIRKPKTAQQLLNDIGEKKGEDDGGNQ
jgi:hypothetical protein